MSRLLSAAVVLATVFIVNPSGQAPAVVDTTRLGPLAGSPAPAFAGVDQFGKSHTLASTYGPQGTMIVFFRSADW